MPRFPRQKTKLLHIHKLLCELSDEEHPLAMKQIIAHLAAVGIEAERKALYDDMEALRQFGLDIVKVKGKASGYYLASRPFELAELKLLVDSVQSAKFITKKKTLQLIRKISALASKYEAEQLQRQVYVSNRAKSMNESIYYNVDKLHSAIAANCQISFRYFTYTVSKQQRPRRNGALYRVSPYTLLWDDDRYYLIGYDGAQQMVRHYRVDRMLDLEPLPAPREGAEQLAGVDPARYAEQTFGMFGGESRRVTLKFAEGLADVVIDRFGKEVMLIPEEPGWFSVEVEIVPSRRFLAWVFGFGKECLITAPPEVREQMLRQLEAVSSLYASEELDSSG